MQLESNPSIWLGSNYTLYNTLINVTPAKKLLQNSYFEYPIIKLHVLYVLNIYANSFVNWMLFTIQYINSYFMYYFKL